DEAGKRDAVLPEPLVVDPHAADRDQSDSHEEDWSNCRAGPRKRRSQGSVCTLLHSPDGGAAELLVRAVLGRDGRLQRRALAVPLEVERDLVAGLESEEDRRVPFHVLEVLAVDREQEVAFLEAGLL